MVTRNFIPQNTNEGSIGIESNYWNQGFFNEMNINKLIVKDSIQLDTMDLGESAISQKLLFKNGFVKYANKLTYIWVHSNTKNITANTKINIQTDLPIQITECLSISANISQSDNLGRIFISNSKINTNGTIITSDIYGMDNENFQVSYFIIGVVA